MGYLLTVTYNYLLIIDLMYSIPFGNKRVLN